jgi:low affinity Fe/Cu permease
MTPTYDSPDTSDMRRHEVGAHRGGGRPGSVFRRLAVASATIMGSPWAFVAAVAGCLVWAVAGPLCHYSDTWQLTINTATTVLTFLAVFLIQNTQNRDALAMQLKLDELLRAVEQARTGLVNLDQCSDEELAALRAEFERLGDRAGGPDATLPTRPRAR